MTDDPIAAELAPVRERMMGATFLDGPLFAAIGMQDAPRLLAALDAALEHHRPVQLYGFTEDFKGNAICGHDGNYDGDQHFEGDDGLWYCKDKPTVTVCGACCDGPSGDLMEEWPCPTYAAILAALAGKEPAS